MIIECKAIKEMKFAYEKMTDDAGIFVLRLQFRLQYQRISLIMRVRLMLTSKTIRLPRLLRLTMETGRK